jgi:hypothetical protein
MEQDSMEMGFDIPSPGRYIVTIEEGIDKYTNQNTGKTSLQVPFRTLEALDDGDKESEGKTFKNFFAIETPFGEKQVVFLLNATGSAAEFAKKFSDDTPMTDQKVIDGLKIRLANKSLIITINHQKNQKGNDNVNIIKMEKLKAGSTKKASSKPAAAPAPAAEEEEGW